MIRKTGATDKNKESMLNLLNALRDKLVTEELSGLIDRIPNQVGSYDYDPWGFNKEKAKPIAGLMKWLYDNYFRVQAHGLENIPATGRVLVIPNHSGQLPMDGTLIGTALLTNPHGPRIPRAMVERFFPTVPFIGDLLNRMGGVIGDPANCSRMLENEEAIVVFPEGVRGSGKLYRQRYQLQRFGTGFMHLALEHNTPIVPVGVIGCEETMPSLANIEPLAKLLRVPYVPVSVPLPLPAKVSLYFGKPMHFSKRGKKETDVLEKVEQVKDAIRALLEQGLAERESIF
ncbi:MAG: lysophospholipid acyltransferase family protein [Pseudomonadota bacterium]